MASLSIEHATTTIAEAGTAPAGAFGLIVEIVAVIRICGPFSVALSKGEFIAPLLAGSIYRH